VILDQRTSEQDLVSNILPLISIVKLMFSLVPSQPSNVTVVTGGLLQALVVNWNVPERPAGVITSYMVNYNGTTLTTSGNTTNLTIMGLDPFTVYSITVTACTVDGCGNQTNPFLGTTAEEGLYDIIIIIIAVYSTKST